MTGESTVGTERLEAECQHCGDSVDIESTDIFKSVSDQFWHKDCFAEYCYERRSLVATPEGSFKIKPVIVKEIENGQEKVIDSFWRADCPVCYRTHESDEKTEEVRTDFIDQVTDCCDTEWLPPADWVEDCDICGGDHRGSRCIPISRREPFPDPETHRYDCSECEWSGKGSDFEGPDGECPECGTRAVRAVEVATDGGTVEGGTEQKPDDGKAWFAERMWEEMPDDAKEQIRENRNDEPEPDRSEGGEQP